MPTPAVLRRRERGSLLIVAMLLCSIIGISIASYLQLGRTSLTISNRALYNNAAMNLAENGLEEAMYSVNKMVNDSSYTWSDWPNNDGTNCWRKWTGYTFDQNATGILRVYVYNYLGASAPKAVARSTITLGGGTARTVEKYVEVTLRKTSKFANGLVAKNSILFNGSNVQVDSWNSDPDNDGDPSDVVPYSAGVRNDNGSVGSVSVSVDAVGVNNGDVWGFVSTGGDDPSDNVGPTGSILGETSPTGSNVDPSRVATDFTASFDAVSAPTKTYYGVPGGTIGDNMTLPDDVPTAARDADGYYYFTASQINFNNKTLRITDKVVIKLTHATTAISIGGGSGNVSIDSGDSLAIYADGNVDIAGKGVMNGGDSDGDGSFETGEAKSPINFQFWGTKTSGTQSIAIRGNGAFSGTIYAPQGTVEITGGGTDGTVQGSIVANNIKLSGNANFHYDESLANFGGGNPYRISKWREITDGTERNTLAAGVLNF